MKIFVTRNIPNSGLEKLKNTGYDVVISEKDGVLDKEELIVSLKKENPDAVLCLLTDQIDATVFEAAPNAKIFANYAVGFDNIDLEEAKKRNVIITNTPDVLTEAVAEHTVSLLVALARRVVEADKFLRAGSYKGWDPLLLLGTELKGKTLGIVGGGRIGQRVAEIMHKGFDLNIMYHDRKNNDVMESELAATFCPQIDELLKNSDIVSIHLPLLPETTHLINEEKIKMMKPSTLLVNTARGAVVDETALAKALQEKTIAGAALDVFENEPTIHPDLLELPNVILTPHIASATQEARQQMSTVAADNIIAVLNNQSPLNPV